jgi:hypothetical protein
MLRPGLASTQAICLFLGCIWFATPAELTLGGEAWKTLGEERGEGQVRLKCPIDCQIRSDRPFFVITHGMNGISEGDRFHELGETIAGVAPEANIVLIDWSEASRASIFPVFVAWSIDSIADEACDELRKIGFQAERTTLIGESFGNYVNARIASNIGKVDQIIAMNPASELGGYPIPDLRLCSRVSCSFHAYCAFDTCRTLAHATILLETPDEATELEKHTTGIRRLTERLAQGDLGWLAADRELPGNQAESFRVQATIDGRLIEIDSPKVLSLPDPPAPPKETSQVDPLASVAGI